MFGRTTIQPSGVAGERMALVGERIAILEAQRAEDKSLIRDHIDGCTEKWAEAKLELKQLSDRFEDRFDKVERRRENQHRANLALLGSIFVVLVGGFATAFAEYMLHIRP